MVSRVHCFVSQNDYSLNSASMLDIYIPVLPDNVSFVAAPGRVWSFMLLKFALNLLKWSRWDQISLLQEAPVVLWQPSGWATSSEAVNRKVTLKWRSWSLFFPLNMACTFHCLLSVPFSYLLYFNMPSTFTHNSDLFPWKSCSLLLILLILNHYHTTPPRLCLMPHYGSLDLNI